MSVEYLKIEKKDLLPRLPLEGSLDLTYRCNNHCRHCWLSIPADAPEKKRELSFKDIRRIADQARAMGCRRWSISGGEPMLRPDFADIFEYLTAGGAPYSLNTNGTLITPGIAKLLKRKGVKMVALYGATAKVHDHITRSPGSFEAAMRGFRYLKEAGAKFVVQLIPMKDNYREFKRMVSLAESLSRHYRVGAAWLFLSASGDTKTNQEIARQRLAPEEAVELDKPDLSYEGDEPLDTRHQCRPARNGGHLFSACIAGRREFHIDPYGKGSFCCFIKDPKLRCDLTRTAFPVFWDKFIPSLAAAVRVTEEYRKNCGSCALRQDCRVCPVYSYLEHRRYGAKVDYLCAVAKENKQYKEEWLKKHRRFYRIADMTVRVDADLPMTGRTFDRKFRLFEASGPNGDTISLRHHFSLPDISVSGLGQELYRKPPWAIYKKGDSWIYLGIAPQEHDKTLHRVVVCNADHTRLRIYNPDAKTFLRGGLHSLTLFPTDQVLLARILADREGCYLHASGVKLDNKGFLFAGHSEAGKTTIARMLQPHAELLCDDRMIVRRRPQGFTIYGTWSHGDIAEVSASSAPLRAILFLEKAGENRAIPMDDRKEISRRLISCLIKPFATADWWAKSLALIDRIACEVPCYCLRFDKSGKCRAVIQKL